MIRIMLCLSAIITLFSCNSDFNSPSQALNEVTKEGWKDGRWIEYLGENFIDKKRDISNDYDSTRHVYFRLIEYDQGIAKGLIREYRISDSSLAREYYVDMEKPSSRILFSEEKYRDTLKKFLTSGNIELNAYYHYDSSFVFFERFTYNNDKSVTIWSHKFHFETPKERQELMNQIDPKYLSGDDLTLFLEIRDKKYVNMSNSTKVKLTSDKKKTIEHIFSFPELGGLDYDTVISGLLLYFKNKSVSLEEKQRIAEIDLSDHSAECGLNICNKEVSLDHIYYEKMDRDRDKFHLKEYVYIFMNEGRDEEYFKRHIGFFACDEICLAWGKEVKYGDESYNSSYQPYESSNNYYRSNGPEYKACYQCNRSSKFTIWKGSGWKTYEETKPGWVKCSGCKGYGYNESYSYPDNVTRKKCYVSSCVNGWTKCRSCYGKGKVKQ